MNTTPTTTSMRHRRSASGLALGLVVATLVASGCALPFADSGDDISAEIEVGGVATGSRGTNEAEPLRDVLGDDDAPPAGDNSVDPDAPDDPESQLPTSTSPDTGDGPVTPIVELDTRFDGRSTQYLGIKIEVGDLIVTNQSLEEYLDNEAPTEATLRLLTEVAVTNTGDGSASVPRDVFSIELASGERVAPEEMRTADGEVSPTIRPAAQATERVVLAFPDVDLAGASLVISEGNTIPQYIPLDLDVPVPQPYEMTLAGQPSVSGLRAPSPWPNSCDYVWTGEVRSARIVLEGVDGSRLERARKGTRWLAVELRATNDTTTADEFYPCNTVGLALFDLEPRFRIDGALMSPTNDVPIGPRMEEAASATVDYWFPMPVDTTEIAVTDLDGTVIASWLLSLPPVPGEE